MDGAELRARRIALGLGQAALAEELGLKQTYISRWENGVRPIPAGIDGELAALEDAVEGRVDLLVERGSVTFGEGAGVAEARAAVRLRHGR